MRRLLLACALLGVSAAAVCGQDSVLLTANGKAAAGAGCYAATPAFSSPAGEGDRVDFARGALTDGNATFTSARPAPYAYWSGQARGELVFRFGRNCQLDRVRVCLLNQGPHGTSVVDVYVTGDPLEFPEVLKAGTLSPARDGWNELPVNRAADGLRLVFRREEGRQYVTVSEVEVWGKPLPAAAPAVAGPAAAGTPRRQTDGHTWWAFDFGPADSPSFAGFYVCDSHCVYSKERGFGWVPYREGKEALPSNFGPGSTEVPGLGERDRNTRSGGTDSLFRDFVMTSAYYHTQVRQTFALDLPNGTYRVLTCHGDRQYGRRGRQSFWLETEGKVAVRAVDFPPGLTTDTVHTVTVTDGQLTLTLDARAEDPAQRGFVLNGLLVLPANTPAEQAFADKRCELLRRAVEREHLAEFEATFTEVPYLETATMLTPSAADGRRGFVAWTPHWMSLIYPVSVPTAEAARHPFRLAAAPGEYEPVVVALRALRPLRKVSLRAGALQGPGGATIPAAALDVRVVRCWRQRLGSSWSTQWRVMPELLEKLPAFDLPADTTREFWLTLHVPQGARPGRYRAPVTVSTAGGGAWTGELQVQVLPFRLQPPERTVGMYWKDQGLEEGVLRAQVADLLAHGVTAVTLSTAPQLRVQSGQLVVDTSKLLALLRTLRKLGLTGPAPLSSDYTGTLKALLPDGDQDALYVAVIRELEKISGRPDTLKLLYYPVDEIGRDDKRGELANRLCALTARVPGATSYVTVNDYGGGEKWGQTFDIWCGNIEYTVEQERKLLASGKRYLRYGSAYLNDCRKARNTSGLAFYRRPAEAMYYWHYQCPVADPENDFDGGSRDWCAAYPGPGTEQIPTMDWEAIREGLDDLRYVATLKALGARAAKGTPAQQAAAARAEAELQAILALDAESVSQYTWAETLTHDEYEGLRGRLTEQILALQRVLGG